MEQVSYSVAAQEGLRDRESVVAMSGISALAAVTQLTDAVQTNYLHQANHRRQDVRAAVDTVLEASDRLNERRQAAIDASRTTQPQEQLPVASTQGAAVPLGVAEFEQVLADIGPSQSTNQSPVTKLPGTNQMSPLPLLDGADLVALRLSSDVSAFGIQSTTFAATLQSAPTSNAVPLPEPTSSSTTINKAVQAAQSPEAFNRAFAIPAGAVPTSDSTGGVAVSGSAIQAALAAQPLGQQGSNSQESLTAKYGLGQRSQNGARAVVPNERRRRTAGLDFEPFE